MQKTFFKTRHALHSLALTCALLLTLCGLALSAPAPHRSSPPAMPASFDRETVQRLIDDIELGKNATILKIGYFMRRKAHPLPQQEGFALLKAAVEKAPAGSKKWFVLQSVRAFSAFRAQGIPPEEGLEAYGAIFDHAAEAKDAKADYQLRQAISEFVFSVQGRFGRSGLASDERTQGLLLTAWKAYVTYSLPSKDGTSSSQEPQWADAVKEAGMEDKFIPLLEVALNDPAVPRSYGLLTTAASLYSPTKPDRAIRLLKQAKPLLPKGDLREAGRFYGKLVWLLENDGSTKIGEVKAASLKEAVALQKELLQLTGRGRAELVVLQFRSNDMAAFKGTLTALSAPDANEKEISDAAVLLTLLGRDEKAPNPQAIEFATELLAKYLEAQRTRDVGQELKARSLLGSLYIQQKKWDEAKAVLVVDHLKQPIPPGEAQSNYEDIKRLSEKLSTTKEKRQ